MEEEHLKLVDDASIKQKTPQHKKRKWYHFFSPLLTFVQVLAIALFPKCPICWAAYMGMLGSIGLGNLSYQPWLYPVLIGTLAIYFAALLYRAKFRNGYGPFLVSLGGALLLGLFQWLEITALMYLAVAFFLMGSIWNVLPKQWVLRLTGSRLSI
ncbi:MAG: hypothetical protein DHS20C18_40510 [Saprospiraceae bacterium]|nr:MAG: hypothetical protein DHS20C18_40510 [Saprospiraceae bacterium]